MKIDRFEREEIQKLLSKYIETNPSAVICCQRLEEVALGVRKLGPSDTSLRAIIENISADPYYYSKDYIVGKFPRWMLKSLSYTIWPLETLNVWFISRLLLGIIIILVLLIIAKKLPLENYISIMNPVSDFAKFMTADSAAAAQWKKRYKESI